MSTHLILGFLMTLFSGNVISWITNRDETKHRVIALGLNRKAEIVFHLFRPHDFALSASVSPSRTQIRAALTIGAVQVEFIRSPHGEHRLTEGFLDIEHFEIAEV